MTASVHPSKSLDPKIDQNHPSVSPGLLYFSQLHSHSSSKSNNQININSSQFQSYPNIDDQFTVRPPPNPFSCLDSLRSLEKNLTQSNSFDDLNQLPSDWSTGLNRSIINHPIDHLPSQSKTFSYPVFEDEQLTWKGSCLIWSKGTSIYRKFDFSASNQNSSLKSSRQHVIQALFTYFDSPHSNPSSTSQSSLNLDHSQTLPSNSNPFYRSPEPWSDNQSSNRLAHQIKSWTSSPKKPIRGLCVLLSEVFKIYLETGEEYTLAVPFPIQKIWPVERGIILMKKSTSVRPRAFIPINQNSPSNQSNQIKSKSKSKKSFLGDSRWPSMTQTNSTSDLLMFNSMVTENETRLWSSLAGFDLDDRQVPDHDQFKDEDQDTDKDLSAQLARYWAERKQIESSFLWSLSDPCTHYLQPVLTTEKILLPPHPTLNQHHHQNLSNDFSQHSNSIDSSQSFSKAVVPLIPLVTPPRAPGSLLASGTLVYVADPIINPFHPICITASTEGFTIFICGRLPPNTSDLTSALISSSQIPPTSCIPEEQPPLALNNLPRSPTPPSQPALPQEPQLRRSPRKLATSQRSMSSFEPMKTAREAKTDTNIISPTHSKSNHPPTRIVSLRHPSLARNYNLHHPSVSSTTSISLKKRGGVNNSTASNSNPVGGRRMSIVSNSSNTSFNFGPSPCPTATINGSGLRKSSTRKSLAEQQLEMMSGSLNSRIGTTQSEKLAGTIGLVDRELGNGFDEWFDGILDSEPSDRRVDGQLADEALDPEFVIQTLKTVEVPGRLNAEELPMIHATLYDSRGFTAHLAVCIPSKSHVYIFRLTRTIDSISLHLIGKPLDGTAIGPVLCSRPNVYDLFKFSNSTGLVEILSADSNCVHRVPHPDPIRTHERSVKPAVGSHVEFVFPCSTAQRHQGACLLNVRSDLQMWPMDPLISKVLQVLSEEIGNAQVCHLFQRLINDPALDSSGQSLEITLQEAILGEEILKPKPQDHSFEPDLIYTDMVEELEELRSDPAMSGFLSIRELETTNRSSNFRRPPLKPPGSPRKRKQQNLTRTSLLSAEVKKKIMIGLTKLYADMRCSMSHSAEQFKLGKILVKLSIGLGWIDWTDKLKRLMNLALRFPMNSIMMSAAKLDEPLLPDLYDHLSRISLSANSPFTTIFEPSPNLSIDHQFVQTTPYLGFYGHQNSCLKSQQICQLYRLLFDPKSGPLEAARNVLIQIDRFDWNNLDLDDLWFGIAIPLKEALRYCQFRAPNDLSIKSYQLMGRPDLCILSNEKAFDNLNQMKTLSKKISNPFHITSSLPPSISQLCLMSIPVEKPMLPNKEFEFNNLNIDHHHSSNLSIAARFSDDMRIIEVAKILNYTQEAKVRIHESMLEMTNSDLAKQYSIFFSGLIKKILSKPFGGGCFWYKSDKNLAVNVPMIKLDIRILPSGTLIQPDTNKVEPLGWPRFHAGVAAGLSLSIEPDEFDSSQISLGRPDELDDRHAGYLLGLGLNKHLRSINRVQIFRYLETKHEMTSIAILLGLSAAFIGTGDQRVSSIIAAHVPAMHPTESIQLQVSPLTQAAGFVSFGILHMATANRRLSDGMLREMSRTWRILTDASDGCRESYTLCAGLGYGLVMLGKGTESDTPAHKDLMRTFKSLIHGDGAHPLPGLNPPTTTIDVSVTSPAATLALALLYLKTGKSEAAMLCEIPQTTARLEYIRPDLLMIRTLAKGLIMWQDVETDISWMESFVPKIILLSIKHAEEEKKKLKADWEMIYWSVISGAAFAMALKHAGSASGAVHSILIKLHDRLLKAVSKPVLNVQAKVRRHCLRTCHNVITLGLAIVMTGTGELELLKRLRVAHASTMESTGYSGHLVTHLALGLLFLGGGRYTLNTSNQAIACLVCALYPIFPSRTDDNVHHLQALRHLWALAIHPRCLVARDVDRKGELIFLPVRLRIQEVQARANSQAGNQECTQIQSAPLDKAKSNQLKTKLMTAPTLIPEIDLIESIKVESPRYWPFVLDLATNSRHREYFSKSLTLWVKRKVGHLSYSQDPKGTKSIASRGRGAEEVTACEIDDFGPRSREIRRAMKARYVEEKIKEEKNENLYELIKGFDLDEQSIGLVKYLCCLTQPIKTEGEDVDNKNTKNNLDLPAFATTVLLQCLIEDKLEFFSTYLIIFFCSSSKSTNSNFHRSPFSIDSDRFWQIANLTNFYHDQINEGFIGLNNNSNQDHSSLLSSSMSLIDKNLIFKIQDENFKRINQWSKSSKGNRLIKEYFKNNEEIWLSSHLMEGIEEDERFLVEWLECHKVPSPRTRNTSFPNQNENVEEQQDEDEEAQDEKIKLKFQWLIKKFEDKLNLEILIKLIKMLSPS
ncbi:hypothetical protein O181_008525 [Austropuccinia psidii MF-1]|uniref:Anaphase-promoting complex subunit 1 n=1 Tax=Austropuccinia psidii MF-1 TaxID=1389203 RepID=A0A9Q3BQ39_9BASI|nr:hypothetical protein [Austropuccinia psidii MF-1]